MDDSNREGGRSRYQDTGWDQEIRSVASTRRGSSGFRNAQVSNTDPFSQRSARDYVRGEVHTENVQVTDVTSPIPFQTCPDDTSLDVDGASMMFSSFGQGPQVPYSTHTVTSSDSSRSNSPIEETSPLGSPGSKYEEFVPNTPSDRTRRMYRHRPYTRADINCHTFHGRLASFMVNKWQVPFMNKRLLAEVGFYYAGVNDEVICSGCGETLSGWQRGDDPLVEHLKHFDNDCPNVQQ